jgi:hypothetical protein
VLNAPVKKKIIVLEKMSKSATFYFYKRFALALLAYNFIVWATFSIVYRTMGMKDNFDYPESTLDDMRLAAYHAWMIQTGYMPSDIAPKTTAARTAVAFQSALSWTQTVILLAPWSAVPIT